ncbi:hypothetical protein BC567DRAFT_53696 [Phyllosticta citribraziliensis]
MPRRDKRVRAVKIEPALRWVEQHAAGCAARDRCGFVEWRLPYCLRGSAQLALGIGSRRLLRCSLIILRPHKIPLEFEEHGLRLDIGALTGVAPLLQEITCGIVPPTADRDYFATLHVRHSRRRLESCPSTSLRELGTISSCHDWPFHGPWHSIDPLRYVCRTSESKLEPFE